jgi:hypothetical protein
LRPLHEPVPGQKATAAPLLGHSDVRSAPASGHSICEEEGCFIGQCSRSGDDVQEAVGGQSAAVHTSMAANVGARYQRTRAADPQRPPEPRFGSEPEYVGLRHPEIRVGFPDMTYKRSVFGSCGDRKSDSLRRIRRT